MNTRRYSLSTREDLLSWAMDLLPDPYACPGDVGASFRAPIRRLEWISRPLWAVFSLVKGGVSPDDPRIKPFFDYIAKGLTPDDPGAFEDPTLETRQIVFEQVVYGYGLLCLGDRLLDCLTPEQQDRLVSWLNAANAVELPWGSWYLARVLINCGLRKCGLAYDADRLAADGAAVENMYVGNGWYEDGTPFQLDTYVGSAFHLISLLLERYALSNPLANCIERARGYAIDYRYWFDTQGRALPFGRSLTYRFSQAAFWSAAALMGDEVAPAAEVKDLLLRHLSWWHDHTDAGCLSSVGYRYPGAPVREDYSSPGASFWAFRAFLALALPEDDSFWNVEPRAAKLDKLHVEEEPAVLIESGERHTYMLSAKQYCASGIMGRYSKYGKLCYSTAFGWNASVDGTGIGNFAVDSVLALSIAGTDQFASRGRIEGYEIHDTYVYSLWTYGTVAHVETWLVPVDEYRHIRIHHIESSLMLETYEGGFPVFGWSSKFDRAEREAGSIRLKRNPSALIGEADNYRQEAGIEDISACRDVIERKLKQVSLAAVVKEFANEWDEREAIAVRQNPATNIYSWEQNAVPSLKTKRAATSFHLGCLVYGDPGELR